MSGGLLQLVAYGAQDVYLTGSPVITFFKVAYKRHTNFSIEAIENTFSGTADFERKVQCQVIRNGDLITKVYLAVTLPEVTLTDPLKQCAWVNKVGHALVNSVELTLGGTQIDKQYGDWFNIWTELTRNFAHDRGYAKMIGDVPELTQLSGYLPESQLYVPLYFFFCRNEGLALPLIALQYHDVRLNFEFKRLQDCLMYTNNVNFSGDLKSHSFVDASLYIDYIFLDNDERQKFAKNPHEYLIEQVQYTGDESVAQTSQKYKLSFNHPCKALFWAVKLGNYTSGQRFLAYSANTDDLRLLGSRRFILKCAAYDTTGASPVLVASPSDNKVQPVSGLPAKLLDLFNNLDPRYLSVSALDVDNVSFFGDMLGIDVLSTPVDVLLGSSYRPVGQPIPTQSDGHDNYDIIVRQWDNYGLYLDKSGNPVSTALLQLNGHERFAVRDGMYFNSVQPWQHFSNTPSDGVNVYSFALHPEQHQPSGTCNMSRIDNTTLALTFDPAVTSGSNVISIYALNYNILRIMTGMGGLAYSS